MGLFDFLKPKDITVDNVDTNNIEIPSYMPSSDFEFLVEDVFTISNRGTVVTGRINKGSVRVGDNVRIYDNGVVIPTVITGIEAFRKTLDSASVGENCGLLLSGISREQVKRGNLLIK